MTDYQNAEFANDLIHGKWTEVDGILAAEGLSGWCGACHRKAVWSFRSKSDKSARRYFEGKTWDACHFTCLACGHTTIGWRPAVERMDTP